MKLAIVTTHPIQYFAPWFAYLARLPGIDLRVFYLWDGGVNERLDAGFGIPVKWNIPLLEGYDSEFVPNSSPSPGTGHFFGLWNPQLMRRLRLFRPDAVLLTAYRYATFARLIFDPARRPWRLVFRGDSHRLVPRHGVREAMRRRLIVTAFSRLDDFLYVGTANRDYFLTHGVDPRRLHYSPHAVDNARFFAAGVAAASDAKAWRESLGIPSAHRVVLFAGKFQRGKGPLDLLRAFLAADIRDATLLFVGSGELESALRDTARGDARVRFAPFQNQTFMPRTYAASDLFVLPSFAETWGLAVNEAMCMGLPVVVGDRVGCARDLVVPGETGLVFESGDVASLSNALKRALEDAPRLKAWGENARRKVADFSFERASRGLLEAIGREPPL